jgi:hypothetical protein
MKISKILDFIVLIMAAIVTMLWVFDMRQVYFQSIVVLMLWIIHNKTQSVQIKSKELK